MYHIQHYTIDYGIMLSFSCYNFHNLFTQTARGGPARLIRHAIAFTHNLATLEQAAIYIRFDTLSVTLMVGL